MNVSAAGSNPYVPLTTAAARPAAAAAATAHAQTAGPVDADGDHDGDTGANDRLDVRG